MKLFRLQESRGRPAKRLFYFIFIETEKGEGEKKQSVRE